MTRLSFNMDAVMKHVAHAEQAEEHRQTYGYDNTGPALALVKDEGIYLMSNGLPMLNGGGPDNVVYAAGYGPDNYDGCRAAVGGDDFAERISIDDVRQIHDYGADTLVIELTENSMMLTC